MRVCTEKSTGKLIESQSGGDTQAHLDTLLKNAVNAGYKSEDIEVKFVGDAEFAEIMEKMKPIPTYADLRRAAYPPTADYLDGIVKGDQNQVKKYIEDCLVVKAKFPKP